MSQKEFGPTRKSRSSLAVRVSTWLVLTAIIPLVISMGFSYWEASQKLTDQAKAQLANDARTHALLIDSYLSGKLLSQKSLDYTPVVQQLFLNPAGAPIPPVVASTIIANGQAINKLLDPQTSLVTFFTPDGTPLLFYPTTAKLHGHGKYQIPPADLKRIALGQQFIAGPYYDTTTHQSIVELYTPVVNLADPKHVIGVVRDTMSLDVITKFVNSEIGANGNGSYAFILDQNNVRISDPDPNALFTAIGPLDQTTKQQAQDQNLYNSNENTPVTVVADTTLQGIQSQQKPPTSFQGTPADAPTAYKNETFQVTRLALTSIPWTYFVLTPVNEVTAVANQQLITTGVIAAAVFLLVILIGLIIGRRLAGPILTSVEYLRNSSESLSTLATKQQDAAAEQMWVVDSSQVGLQSVQYYTEATAVAARQLSKIGNDLVQRWGYLDANEAKKALERIISAAQYIENASQYQNVSNQKLATALKVATQVTEQLVAGTTSATDAASQLERVVAQLRAVAGK